MLTIVIKVYCVNDHILMTYWYKSPFIWTDAIHFRIRSTVKIKSISVLQTSSQVGIDFMQRNMQRVLDWYIKQCGSFLKYAVLVFAFVFFVFNDQNQKQYF